LGKDQCADCRNYAPTLFLDSNGRYSFKPTWKARRAHIEVLAMAAGQKLQRAKRIPVFQDTTICKDWNQCRRNLALRRIGQHMTQKGTTRASTGEVHLDLERVEDRINEYLGVSTGRHED
jgi:hypothetical protein